MQVKFTKSYQVKTTTGRHPKSGVDIVGGITYREGQTYDLSPESARHFINRGVAQAVDEDEGAALKATGPGEPSATLPPEQREQAMKDAAQAQRQSREDAEKPVKAEAEPDHPHARKADLEAEGRAPKTPARAPHHKS